MSALKPCPFCGSNRVDPEGWGGVEPDGKTKRAGPACDNCFATADSIAAWNSRAGNNEVEKLRAELAAAREALRNIAQQKIAQEMDKVQQLDADFEYGYDAIVMCARAALGDTS